jgi:hypothetical protein
MDDFCLFGGKAPDIGGGSMDLQERQLVLNQLASSEARLLELVEGLTPQQWRFREKPDRWSIAEIVEHVILFENFITKAITNAMGAEAEPGKRASAAGKESAVLGLANSRSTRIMAREPVRPVGKWPDPTVLVGELRQIRARTLAFAAETQADLRNHFFPHLTLGDLDCFQWLVVLAQHASRHALQIEEIKALPGYLRY